MSVNVGDAAVAAVLGPDLDGLSVEGHTFNIGRAGINSTGDRSCLVSGSIKYIGANPLDSDVQYFYSMAIDNGNVVDLKITAEDGSLWDLIEIAAPIINKATGNKISDEDLQKLQQGIGEIVQSNVSKEVALLLISYISKFAKLRAEANFSGTKRYQIIVKTGSDEDAGTNANVYIKLIGTRGSVAGDTDRRLLGSGVIDNFEAGSRNDFELEVDGDGELQKVQIGHDNSGNKPGWLLEWVKVRVDDREQLFLWNRWLAQDAPDGIETDALSPEEHSSEYVILVQTSDRDGAGTDANVWVELLNESRRTTGRNNLSQAGINNFEKGKLNTFTFRALDVGALKWVIVGHDNAGDKPGWHWAWLKVKKGDEPPLEVLWNKWLAVDELNDPQAQVRTDGLGVRTVELELHPADRFP